MKPKKGVMKHETKYAPPIKKVPLIGGKKK